MGRAWNNVLMFSAFHAISRTFIFDPLQFPLRPSWCGEVNLFSFETIPRYIRMCLESWDLSTKYNWNCQTAEHVRGFINKI